MKNAFSHREMQDDDVILPPTYKENTGWQSIINIAIGLVPGGGAGGVHGDAGQGAFAEL